jgi:hypothetical protein
MLSLKNIIFSSVCMLALAGCGSVEGTQNAKGVIVQSKDGKSFITHVNPSVDVYATGEADKTADAGNVGIRGYTLFDENVSVFPLPGDVKPSFAPDYSVPPLDGQYSAAPPMVGQKPMGLASASTLPPVPNVELPDVRIPAADPYANPPVSGALRAPMALAAPEPLTMQPLAQARAPLPSPFMPDVPSVNKAKPIIDEPVTMANMGGADVSIAEADRALQELMNNPAAVINPPTAPVPQIVTPRYPTPDKPSQGAVSAVQPGRRSAPLLTGY